MEWNSVEARLRLLFVASLDGDRTAYRALLVELTPFLRAFFARRLSSEQMAHADDLVQETLLAMHTRRLTYDRDRPFTAWLHAIAKHKLIDHLRRRQHKSVPLDEQMPAAMRDGTASGDLETVLATLPARTSSLIRTVKVEGSSVAEAASAHGMSETAAKVAIHRGLKALIARFAGRQMNEQLIDRLVSDLRPVRRGTMVRLLGVATLCGMLIAALVMVPWIGLRDDIATAPATAMFWIKFGYTLLIAVLGFGATLALGRPEPGTRLPFIIMVLLFAVTLVGGIVQWTMAAPDLKPILAFGSTALVCPLYIIVFSAPILALTLAIARRFAPANPTLAGLAAGLASGGAGAWIYAFHCGEIGLLFLATWYTVGMSIVAVSGALLGRYLLRW